MINICCKSLNGYETKIKRFFYSYATTECSFDGNKKFVREESFISVWELSPKTSWSDSGWGTTFSMKPSWSITVGNIVL